MPRLTLVSKFLITTAVVGGAYFGIKQILKNTDIGQSIEQKIEDTKGKTQSMTSTSTDENTIDIGVVTWGGYAGGQYFNEGFKANEHSRFYKEYGFKVNFKILDDFEASRAAFKNGDVDLLWATIDALPTEIKSLSAFDPVVLFQADWSRGGDAIVARRGISTVSDLKGKKIAVAELTPSHSFLIWLLNAGGLTIKDVTIIAKANAIDAAEMFKSQSVDAAVVWSPDDEACIKSVPGSRVIESTKNASHIIADIFIAKRKWVEDNRVKLDQLYEGWMKGSAEINSSNSNKLKAARILSENFEGFTEDDTYKAINNVRLTTHGDNKNFFGLSQGYQGVSGNQLYSKMSKVYTDLGFIQGDVPNWRLVAYPSIVQSAQLNGAGDIAEIEKSFAKPVLADASKPAISSKKVSISFRSGEFQVDENAKYIIDMEFADIAKTFANSRVRIEGNTDNVGNRQQNIILSKKRAESVAKYLQHQYNMPSNRFVIVGNGPDNPVSENNSAEGKSKNRRTDFELIGD